jgi:uncharacterized protein (DUF697 family)
MVEKKEATKSEGTIKEEKPVEDTAEVSIEPKQVYADKLVKRYMWWSVGTGFIPIPLLDLGALAGVHMRMLYRLSKHYDVPFSENRGKSILATLIGTITADSLRWGGFNTFIKSIPLVGIVGAVSMPIYSGAVSYAVGKLFIQHFESGGTFLDFDPQKVKEYFAQLYEEGKAVASKLKPAQA